MLSNKTITNALNNKEINITISFSLQNGVPTLYESEQDILSSPLKNNLYSDRLKLTMGPIIKILNKKAINPKYRFKGMINCYDLRKSDDKYIINPGESIIVLTNEKVELNGKYACLIVPRISLSDVGIVVTTAYVDPFYYGLMRLHLSNLSDKAYELTTLESIAQCFFFELSEEVPEMYKEHFSEKSVFFGQTWNGILNTGRKPFPTKKDSASIDRFVNFKYQLNILWSIIKKHSLIFVFFTNIFILLCGFSAFKQQFEKYTDAIKQIEEYSTPASSEIIINAGEKYGEKEITVNCEKSDIVSVLCNNDEIHYKILSGTVENKTKIIFSYSMSSTFTDEYEINFTYIIIRRIN